jgi:hypothetical protein
VSTLPPPYLSVTESSINVNGVSAVDSVAAGPITPVPVIDPPAPVIDPAAPVIDPASTGPTGSGTTPQQAAMTPTTTLAPGCTVRLRKVASKKFNVKRAGRLTVKVNKRNGGKVNVIVKAADATKKRLAKVGFKLDRKTLKRTNGKLRRSFKLTRLKPGKHALKLRVRPRNGKPRILKIALRVTGC